MANYERTFKSAVWTDGLFEMMSNVEKLFYILIHVGEETSDCCMFQITPKRIAFHLGISVRKAEELIESFIGKGLIMYNFEHNEMLVLDYMKHNPCRGGLKYENYKKDFAKIKTQEFFTTLAEIAKYYPVTVGFLSALSEHVALDINDYDVKKSSEDMDSVKTVQQRGRDKTIQKRAESKITAIVDDDDLPF